MPTYEYLCNKCGVVEVQQSMSSKNLMQCPYCESFSFKKKIPSVSISFKGTGFYTTDSKGK